MTVLFSTDVMPNNCRFLQPKIISEVYIVKKLVYKLINVYYCCMFLDESDPDDDLLLSEEEGIENASIHLDEHMPINSE